MAGRRAAKARRHGFGEWRLGDEARPGRRAERTGLPAARLLPGSSRTWLGAASVLLALAVWQGVVAVGLAPGDLVPPPTAVWRAFVEILRHGYRDTTLGEDIGATLGRALAGFGLGALLGVPLGLWMGMSRRASAAFGWIVQFMRPLPPLSFLVLLILWLGLGEASKIALLTMTAFPIITSASQAAVRGVPVLQVAVARSLGATPWQVFGHVVLPASLPMIFTGLTSRSRRRSRRSSPPSCSPPTTGSAGWSFRRASSCATTSSWWASSCSGCSGWRSAGSCCCSTGAWCTGGGGREDGASLALHGGDGGDPVRGLDRGERAQPREPALPARRPATLGRASSICCSTATRAIRCRRISASA